MLGFEVARIVLGSKNNSKTCILYRWYPEQDKV